jgi:hypothetical protein
MKHIRRYQELFEARSSVGQALDSLVLAYLDKQGVTHKHGDLIGHLEGVKVKVIDPELLKYEAPEWATYIGSHHWGKQTDYIPDDEVWIVKGLDADRVRKLLNHEFIEREMMRALEEEHGMDRQTAWEQAHYYVKQLGF